jgi:hypothetical protein
MVARPPLQRLRAGRIELSGMTLSVLDRQRITLEILRAGDGQHRGRIQPTGQQNDCPGDLATLLPRHIAPQNLVELNLKPHRQAILENPVRQVARGQLLVAR